MNTMQNTAAAGSRPHTLVRSRKDRMLAGVASGLAAYCGIDALLVRLGFAVLVALGGTGIPLYLACWLLIPDAGTGRSIVGDVTSGLQDWKN